MDRSWTIQILPQGTGRTRSFRLRRRTLRWCIGGATALLVLAVAGIALGVRGAWQTAQLVHMRSENRTLLTSLQAIHERMGHLAEAVDDFSSREQNYRLTAGLPLLDPDVQGVGIGGPPIVDPTRQALEKLDPGAAGEDGAVDRSLDYLLRRARLLTTSLTEATDSLEVHRALFLSRPSIRPVPADESWISSGYSHSRFDPVLLYNRPHLGIDLSAPLGSPIRAAARGVVAFAGKDSGYGNMVELDHGYGFETRYAHASRILVHKGERVQRGQVIALVGETGLATGPHLHYEVLIHGHHVNPTAYLLGDRLFE